MLFCNIHGETPSAFIGIGKGSALWEKKLLGYFGIRDGGSRASLRMPGQGHQTQVTLPEL